MLLAMCLVFISTLVLAAHPVNIQKTGQDQCFDEMGEEIGCGGTGQDGGVQAGIEWPIPRFESLGTGCLLDRLTGLTWTSQNVSMAYEVMADYLHDLNGGSGPCGYMDWRVPTVIELMTLMNLGAENRAEYLNNNGFEISEGQYVSDTGTHVLFCLWSVHLGTATKLTGYVGPSDVAQWLFVRGGAFGKPDGEYPANPWNQYPGRGGPGVDWPARAVDNGDNTITDKLTGLMWAKNTTADVRECNEDLSTYMTWQEALDYIQCLNGINYLGHGDWRLPNVMEALSTVNWDNGSSVFRGVAILPADPNTYSNWFWTSDSGLRYKDYAIIFEVSGPNAGPHQFDQKLRANHVWPVRGEPGYNLMGIVTEKGSPLAGVTLTLSGTDSGTTQTDFDGTYAFIGLARGSYTITPSMDQCIFDPGKRSVILGGSTIRRLDFAGTRLTYSISGSVKTAAGEPLPSVPVNLDGTAKKTTTTAADGSYRFTGLTNGTYTLQPAKTSYLFKPEQRTLNIAGKDVAGQDFQGSYGLGFLKTSISPQEAVDAGARWRVDDGSWQASGTKVQVSVGLHQVSFKDISGWTTPATRKVVVKSGGTSTVVGKYRTDGSLKVTLSPDGAVGAGARWSVDAGAWRKSGTTVEGLSVGPHEVAFKDLKGWTPPTVMKVPVKAGKTTTIIGSYVPDGSLKVTISPKGAVSAGARWRLDGGAWRKSGTMLDNLSAGSHEISFKDLRGWTPEAARTVTVDSGRSVTVKGTYTRDGSLKVTISPESAVNAGARWRADGGAWQESGTTLDNLSAGSHEISFKDLSGWTAPGPSTVTVASGRTTTAAGEYTAMPLSNTSNRNTWFTNGTVYAVATTGDTTYIGGLFSYVGPYTGCGVPFDVSTGAMQTTYPAVNGTVFAVVPDGSGGWFVGGSFSEAGGTTRNNLAHIRSDGSLDPSWDPDANDKVSALSVSGGTVYVGGSFTRIGGLERNRIAAVDASTGAVTDWDPNADAAVSALVVNDGLVYVGGDFSTIGGQSRSYIAALDASTGDATPWDPYSSGSVNSLAVGGNTLYVGGNFLHIGGTNRRGLAAIDAYGHATSWNPDPNGSVYALAVNGETIYAGGFFTSIGGQSRRFLAALDASTGDATDWNPDPDQNGYIYALAANAATVYVGGSFTSIGGEARSHLAAVDPATGRATDWNPGGTGGTVTALAASGGTVYVGGTANSMGGYARNNLAALDASGKATSWDPGADNTVLALTVNGDTVYAGGRFTNIGGRPRNYVAALDAATGAATDWDPGADREVLTLLVNGDTVYAGGRFTGIGGQSRNRIAALDVSTGVATNWNPGADNLVEALGVKGDRVYAGGTFTSIGGQSRSRIAALDAATGAATDWNPGTSGTYEVAALAVSGDMVYVGGNFSSIGGQSRTHIAALDVATGNASSFQPSPNQRVLALAVSGDTVYAGGFFSTMGGQSRISVAGLDASTGSPTSWAPNVSATGVKCLAVLDDRLYVGGGGFMVDKTQSNFARFDGRTDPIE